MDRQEWRWEGGLWDFIEIVQWAFVFHRLGREQPDGWNDIVSSPERVRSAADGYGMTYQAIAREMVRCGNDAMNMLDILDARRAGESGTDKSNGTEYERKGCDQDD